MHGLAQLRDLAGLASLQARRKNQGLAAGARAGFFERNREVGKVCGAPRSGDQIWP
jgi:hypothetical protein